MRFLGAANFRLCPCVLETISYLGHVPAVFFHLILSVISYIASNTVLWETDGSEFQFDYSSEFPLRFFSIILIFFYITNIFSWTKYYFSICKILFIIIQPMSCVFVFVHNALDGNPRQFDKCTGMRFEMRGRTFGIWTLVITYVKLDFRLHL